MKLQNRLIVVFKKNMGFPEKAVSLHGASTQLLFFVIKIQRENYTAGNLVLE